MKLSEILNILKHVRNIANFENIRNIEKMKHNRNIEIFENVRTIETFERCQKYRFLFNNMLDIETFENILEISNILKNTEVSNNSKFSVSVSLYFSKAFSLRIEPILCEREAMMLLHYRKVLIFKMNG